MIILKKVLQVLRRVLSYGVEAEIANLQGFEDGTHWFSDDLCRKFHKKEFTTPPLSFKEIKGFGKPLTKKQIRARIKRNLKKLGIK